MAPSSKKIYDITPPDVKPVGRRNRYEWNRFLIFRLLSFFGKLLSFKKNKKRPFSKFNAVVLIVMLGFGFSLSPVIYAESDDGETTEETETEEPAVQASEESADEKNAEEENFDDIDIEIIKIQEDVDDADVEEELEEGSELGEGNENNAVEEIEDAIYEDESIEEEIENEDEEKNAEEENFDEVEEEKNETSETEKENEEINEEEFDVEEDKAEETDNAQEEEEETEEVNGAQEESIVEENDFSDSADEKENVPETTTADYDVIYKEIEALFKSQIENYKENLQEKEKTIEGFEEKISNFEQKTEEKETASKEQVLKEIMEKCFEMDGGGIFCPGRSLSVYNDERSEAGGLVKVFSVKSEKGNYEIYFQANNRVVQITDNERDDVSPKWDAENNLIVWQGQIDGRWRIFVYERNTGKSYTLTDGGLNDINPEVHSGTVVWQGWIDGRWEIFSARKTDGAWGTKRITKNGEHDINPSVAAGIITWQSQKDAGWQVVGHNISTGETFEVSQGIGKNKNPRVAIIWESEESGSISTLAYRLDSGLVTAVSLPRENNHSFPEIPALPTKEQEAVFSTSTSVSRDKEEGEGL